MMQFDGISDDRYNDPPLYHEDTNTMTCPVCSSEVRVRQLEPFGTEWYCTNPTCAWGPLLSPHGVSEKYAYLEDQTEYSLYVTFCGNFSLDQIRVLSKVSGHNYLEIKKMRGKYLIKKGFSSAIIPIRDSLRKVDIAPEIHPHFPW